MVEQQIVAHLVNEFLVLCGIRNFIKMFTRVLPVKRVALLLRVRPESNYVSISLR
jgi:hypothetical protein